MKVALLAYRIGHGVLTTLAVAHLILLWGLVSTFGGAPGDLPLPLFLPPLSIAAVSGIAVWRRPSWWMVPYGVGVGIWGAWPFDLGFVPNPYRPMLLFSLPFVGIWFLAALGAGLLVALTMPGQRARIPPGSWADGHEEQMFRRR